MSDISYKAPASGELKTEMLSNYSTLARAGGLRTAEPRALAQQQETHTVDSQLLTPWPVRYAGLYAQSSLAPRQGRTLDLILD